MIKEKIRVLLVEDDAIDQLAFKRLVEDENLPYTYAIAGSVSEARKVLSEEQFDIIISDYSLGDGTAFDVLEFKKHPPVIMITGVGNEEIAVTAMKKGAYDYLIKDLDRNYLKVIPATVENTIKRREMEEEKEQLLKDLQNALARVKQLSGMLPICSFCKKIRDDKGYWTQLEEYISEHSEAEFTHGLCAECADTHYREFLKKDKQ